MPIQLSDESKQAILDMSGSLQDIENELRRAEMAGLNITRLRERYNALKQQHAGVLSVYVNNADRPRRSM